jgi:hypothetical protein
METLMSKTNEKEIRERTERQAENSSGGGHLGGTYFGQEPDGKTVSATNKEARKTRSNDG